MLAELPGNWTILRNRRTAAADGPPWVKYIALNPDKGIALIDLLPAQPEAAVAPLEEFLARTGFSALSRGDPPIVAIALTADEITSLSDLIDAAFADAPRCGIKNENWPSAIAELLMSTQGLLLTQLDRPADAPAAAPAPRAVPEPDIAREARIARQPRPAPEADNAREARVAREPPTAPEPDIAREADVMRERRTAPEPHIALETNEPKLTPQPAGKKPETAARPRNETPRGPGSAKAPKASRRSKEAAVWELALSEPILEAPRSPPAQPVASEPARRSNSPRPAQTAETRRARKDKPLNETKPILAVRTEAATFDDRPFPIERRERRSAVPWLIAASASAIAAIAVLYPHARTMMPSLWQATDNVAAAPTSPPPVTAMTAPNVQTTPSSAQSAPPAPATPQASTTPQAPSTPQGPTATPQMPATSQAPTTPEALPTHEVPPLAPPVPSTQPAVAPPSNYSELPTHNVLLDEAANPPQSVASAPPDAGIGPNAAATPDPSLRTMPPKRVKRARARPPADDDALPGLLPPPQGEETVTIDGMTYIKGREPRSLGTVPMPPDGESTAAPQSLFPPQ
jgi:hypothetical protein